MDCPPPLSSEDEDDDFGDFHTVFEKSTAADSGSIKSRINLDIPVSPESSDSPPFTIPERSADFSIDSNSPPPELPPSLPMSPEIPDVDFFTLPDAPRILDTNRKSPVVEFTNSEIKNQVDSDASLPVEQEGRSFPVQDDILQHIPKEENNKLFQPDDQFANFDFEDKFKSSDNDFFEEEGVKSGSKTFGVDFNDFETQASGEQALQERTSSDEVPMNVESDNNDYLADSLAGNEEVPSDDMKTTVFSNADELFNADGDRTELDQDDDSVNSAIQEKEVDQTNFDFETATLTVCADGEKAVFSWDSFEETTGTVDVVDNEKQEFDKETERFAAFTDEVEEKSILPDDQFASFDDFATATEIDTSPSNVQHNQELSDVPKEIHSENTVSFDDKEETGEVIMDQELENTTVSEKQDNFDIADLSQHDMIEAKDGSPVFDAFSSTNNYNNTDIPSDFVGTKEAPGYHEFTDVEEKNETDDFADFAAGDNDESSDKKSDDDSFGNFADFGAQPNADDFSDFADFKQTNDSDDEDFGDFSDFDSKVAESTTVSAVKDDFDDDFDDFADFGSASRYSKEQPSPAAFSFEEKSEPISMAKAIGTCYGISSTDEGIEAESEAYSSGLLFMSKVHDTDAQFAVGTKWLATPSFSSQVATLCLSSNNSSVTTSKPSQVVPGQLEDEFSVFGSVNTDQLASSTLTSSNLLPEDLNSTAPPPPPAASTAGKHADILSGYKKEQAKKLSAEAAAIVDSLPDLSFMLSSVLMFPVKAL